MFGRRGVAGKQQHERLVRSRPHSGLGEVHAADDPSDVQSLKQHVPGMSRDRLILQQDPRGQGHRDPASKLAPLRRTHQKGNIGIVVRVPIAGRIAVGAFEDASDRSLHLEAEFRGDRGPGRVADDQIVAPIVLRCRPFAQAAERVRLQDHGRPGERETKLGPAGPGTSTPMPVEVSDRVQAR